MSEYRHPLWVACHSPDTRRVQDICYLLLVHGANLPEDEMLRMCRRQTHLRTDGMFTAMAKAKLNFAHGGPSVLEFFAEKGNIAEVGCLLDAGIDINAYGMGGSSALQAAAWGGHLGLMRYLIGRGANVNLAANEDGAETALAEWRRTTRQDNITRIIFAYPSYNWQFWRLTALQAAAAGRHSDVVDCLITAGATVTAPAAKITGLTVLESTAYALFNDRYGQAKTGELVSTFKKLHLLGAPINREDGTDCVVLHFLVLAHQLECLNLALDANANTEGRLNVQDRTPGEYGEIAYPDMTPFQIAAANHNMDAMQTLLRHGAKVDAPASNICLGRTALQAAVDQSRSSGGDADSRNTEEIVSFLLREGAAINAQGSDNFGRTALQMAASQQVPDVDIIALLLQNGADVNAPAAKRGGLTALQGASISGHIDAARMLISHGADVNAPAAPEVGRTALEGAAEHGRLDMARLLLYHGAGLGDDTQFAKAKEFAERNENFSIVHLLESWQGRPDQRYLTL